MRLLDSVQLATTTSDGYGDRTVTVLTTTKALFVHRSGVTHVQNADTADSDAAVYLDPTNSVVRDRMYELEGLYIVTDGRWYRVTHATVAQRKLLNNAIDNIYCLLEKEAGIPYVSYIS